MKKKGKSQHITQSYQMKTINQKSRYMIKLILARDRWKRIQPPTGPTVASHQSPMWMISRPETMTCRAASPWSTSPMCSGGAWAKIMGGPWARGGANLTILADFWWKICLTQRSIYMFSCELGGAMAQVGPHVAPPLPMWQGVWNQNRDILTSDMSARKGQKPR